MTGDVVACAAIKAAVKRHLDDLQRAGEDDFPYYFDEQAAEFYCDCFPALLRHSKGKLNHKNCLTNNVCGVINRLHVLTGEGPRYSQKRSQNPQCNNHKRVLPFIKKSV